MSTDALYTRGSSPRISGVKMVGAGSPRRYPEPERACTLDAEPMSDSELTLAEITRYMKSVGADYNRVQKDLNVVQDFSLRKSIMDTLEDKGRNVESSNEFFKYTLHTVSLKLLPIIESIVRHQVLVELRPSAPDLLYWAKVNVHPVLGIVASKVTRGTHEDVLAVKAQLSHKGIDVIKFFNKILNNYPELVLYHAFVPRYSDKILKMLDARRVKYFSKPK